MSLTQLVAIPEGPRGFDEYCWDHLQHHLAIIGAARQIKGVSLTQYQIWPFNPHNPQGFLLQHQYFHNDMNALYGINGADLSDLDFTNPKQLGAWVYLNEIEHRGVAALCGLPI